MTTSDNPQDTAVPQDLPVPQDMPGNAGGEAAARCAECDFFAQKNEAYGDCRLNPPTPLVVGSKIRTVFPSVALDCWCGAFSGFAADEDEGAV